MIVPIWKFINVKNNFSNGYWHIQVWVMFQNEDIRFVIHSPVVIWNKSIDAIDIINDGDIAKLKLYCGDTCVSVNYQKFWKVNDGSVYS